jgi:hypothetical protein
LYSKSNEKHKEKDPDRQVKLVKKALQAKEAAVILADKSESVKAVIQARKNQQNKSSANTARKNTTTASSAAAATAGTTISTEMTKKRPIDPTTGATGVNDNHKKSKSDGLPTLPQKRDLMKWEAENFLKSRLAKDFDGTFYNGIVKRFIPPHENDEGVNLWLVEYDDGDSEDLEKDEMVDCILQYMKMKQKK